MWILCKMGPLIMLDRKGCHSVFRRIKQFKNKPKLALRLNKLWGSVTVVSLCDPCDGARTNLTCLLFIDLMRTDKALQNLWRMSSVSEKTQANRQHFVWFWGLFPKICCLHKISNTMVFVLLFFLCALKAFMETQCLHFRFPSTRGKQISKSDTSSSYETSRHRFLFLWMYIYKIYVNIYCIMYVHTHIHIHMYVCMLKFSSTQQMVGECIGLFLSFAINLFADGVQSVMVHQHVSVLSREDDRMFVSGLVILWGSVVVWLQLQ